MISIIIPCLNEDNNIPELYRQISRVLGKRKYEIVFVNDGSTDTSADVLQTISKEDTAVTVVTHHIPQGKGQSLADGMEASSGDIVVFMDGDLQHDPSEIVRFLEKIDEGYEYVNGRRDKRDDSALVQMYSKAANWFIRTCLDVPFEDINSGFKVFKRSVMDDVPLYGNNFRFVMLAAYFKGHKTGEITITNRARSYGVSKFGNGKVFVGVLDTITAYFIYRFAERPLHFFGAVGLASFSLGFVYAFILSFERIFFGTLLYRRPSLLFAVLLMIVGIQILMTGFIGELVVYYHKKRAKK